MSGQIGDNVARASGVVAAAGGGGKVLQVLQATITDTFSVSTTTFTDITGLTIDITPAATSSKILVMVNF